MCVCVWGGGVISIDRKSIIIIDLRLTAVNLPVQFCWQILAQKGENAELAEEQNIP